MGKKLLSYLNRPLTCKVCSGVMIYKGLGEYRCEECDYREYDDYGTVRNYIEAHPGANIAVVSESTGVTRQSINDMLKESRFEIADSSKTFLKCEICGKNIRYGRMCPECEQKYHRDIEAQTRSEHQFSGVLSDKSFSGEGKMRFRKEGQEKND